jgi:hypothetical protein
LLIVCSSCADFRGSSSLAIASLIVSSFIVVFLSVDHVLRVVACTEAQYAMRGDHFLLAAEFFDRSARHHLRCEGAEVGDAYHFAVAHTSEDLSEDLIGDFRQVQRGAAVIVRALCAHLAQDAAMESSHFTYLRRAQRRSRS